MKITKKRIMSFVACLGLAAFLVLPGLAGAQLNTGDGNLQRSGLSNAGVGPIVIGLMNWLLWIVLFVAIIGFVISGILFITAGGSDRADQARKWLTGSIIGIIVAMIGMIVIAWIDDLLIVDLNSGQR